MKVNLKQASFGFFLLLLSLNCFALQERHLIFIRQGGESALTTEGKVQIKQTSDILLTHGFDNRSIKAVYVAPDKGSQLCAKMLASQGLFDDAKIMRDSRLGHKKKSGPILSFYDDIEKKYKEGHIIVIDDNTRSNELILALTQEKPESRSNQPYILPFSLRQSSFA